MLDFIRQYRTAFFAALVAFVVSAFAYDTRVSFQPFINAVVIFGIAWFISWREAKAGAEARLALEDIRQFIGVVAGYVLVIAAAFGVVEFVQPSPNVTMAIQLVAALILALYKRFAR